jgi:2-octaprenylphenol hydroxylase
MKINNTDYDIAIVGAGLVGSIQALLLAQQGFNILLLDVFAEPQQKYLNADHSMNLHLPPDLRMSAITLKSEDILTELGVWDLIKLRSGVMQKTEAWEEQGSAEIIFDSLRIGKNHLSTIVENNLLHELINAQLKSTKNVVIKRPCTILDIQHKANNLHDILTQDNNYSVKLIIGADGANSWVRKYFNFDCTVKDYNHTALVTNIYTEKPHDNIAYQKFLKTGPLAFLPWMHPYCSSIVWSQNKEQADYWQNCSEIEFHKGLEEHCNTRLGKITASLSRVSYPLIMRHVKQYYKSGVVLIGDAAHTIHPLAGQGLNLGIYDAYELTNILIMAKQRNYNINHDQILHKYQLKRRGHNQQMLNTMQFFKDIYASDYQSINLIRSIGINALNNIDFIKKKIMNFAAGQY